MNKLISFSLVFFGFWLFAGSVFAQSSEFAFQGRLTDSGVPVAVNYDLRFKLYSQSAGGTAIGTVERTDVPVSNGVFTVKLDFGAAAFDGAARWIETEVKPSGSGTYQPLNPRVFLTTVPYAVRSLSAENAGQLGGVTPDQYVLTGDARLSNARNPLPNSPNYVQNIDMEQPSSNFHISGRGRANLFDAATQYSIAGFRVLSVYGTSNLFAGIDAGSATIMSQGQGNSFFGNRAGQSNIGSNNSFFGAGAGRLNTFGFQNSFFGVAAGGSNNTGINNDFFGSAAGSLNTNGGQNSFFGSNAGLKNVSGSNNSFFGFQAGRENTSNENSFFGNSAGLLNTTGTGNSFFGRLSGESNTIGLDNALFGYNSGRANTIGNRNTFYGSRSGRFNSSGDNNTFVGYNAASSNLSGSNNTAIGANADILNGLTFATAVGAGTTVGTSNTIQIGRSDDTVNIAGKLKPFTLGSAGATQLCRNNTNEISTCSSSIRYKTNVNDYSSGIELIRTLRPVSFNWKESGMPDIGLVAEEVAEAEPLLTTKNANGEIEGVKYDRVGVVLVNAVNEQQTQIVALNKTVVELKREIEELRSLLCSAVPNAAGCRQQ